MLNNDKILTTKVILKLLQREILWCKENKSLIEFPEQFGEGFIEGLVQAERIIREADFEIKNK